MGEQKTMQKMPKGKMFAWATRPISLGAISIIIGFFSLYCTNTLNMSPVLVGSLLMASKIFDGVTDLLAGWLVDNTHTKWGKGRPYELCIIGAWICMWALFSIPEKWSVTGKSVWIFIMYTLVFSVFSTLLNACETVYMIRAFKDKFIIGKIASYVGVLCNLGGAVVSMLVPMAIGRIATSASGWSKMMAMFGIPLVILGIIRFFVVKEEYEPEREGGESDRVTIKAIFGVLAGNRYIWLVAIAAAIPNLIMGMSGTSYYFTSVVGNMDMLTIVTAFSALTSFFMVFIPVLMKRFSVMQITAIFAAAGACGYIINFFAGGNMPLLVIGAFLGALSALPMAYLRSPVVMQIAEYNAANRQPRMESTLAAVVNFLCKVGSALGSFLTGILLSVGGYDGSLAVQSDRAVFSVRMVYGLVPAVLISICILCYLGFRPLDEWSKEHNLL